MKTVKTFLHQKFCLRMSQWIFSCCLALGLQGAALANNGEVDEENLYPAVGYSFMVFSNPEPVNLYPLEDNPGFLCSVSLISESLVLTASHCALYLSESMALPGNNIYVSFYPVIKVGENIEPISGFPFETQTMNSNDLNCYLNSINHPIGELPCDRGTLNREIKFHKVKQMISIKGATDPGEFGNADNYKDLALLVLEKPIRNIQPVTLPELGYLETVPDLKDKPLTFVGSGFAVNKNDSPPQTPGVWGPTIYYGFPATKRIAQVGPTKYLTKNWVTPRQSILKGDNTVCYGDSGGPLFMGQPGQTMLQVGVLSGGLSFCEGDHDPWQRIDTVEALQFINCVQSAVNSKGDPCVCGVEAQLGISCDISK